VISAWVTETGASPSWWNSEIGFTALAMTLTGMASVVSSTWWGDLHDRRIRFLTPSGAILLSASMLLLSINATWWNVLLARVGVGIGIASISTLQFAVIAKAVASDERGKLMGLATAFAHVGNLVGFALGGVLAAWWSETGNFILAAGIYALFALAAVRLERSAPSSTKKIRNPVEGRCGMGLKGCSHPGVS
jgi:MFS family permease